MNRKMKSPSKNAINTFQQQQGFTLVELMVAMTLGLFLTAGIMQVFMASQQTYRTLDGQSRLQENGRFSMMFIGDVLHHAGHRYNPVPVRNVVSLAETTLEAAFPEDNAFTSGQFIHSARASGTQESADINGIGGVNNIKAGTDVILVRFQGHRDGIGHTCTGRRITTNDTYVQMLYVRSTDDALVCASTVLGTDAAGDQVFTFAATERQALVDGVESMQVLYGVDSRASATRDVDEYVDGATVANWQDVVAVKVALLVRSGNENDSVETHSSSHSLLGAAPIDHNDQRLRQVFTRTFALRNRSAFNSAI